MAGKQRVADIAEQQGFSDESEFVRAFRRWQGVTPARFKAQGGGRD
ncbi:helix-turn-helix domain-containing protein [Pseudomonas sp. NyZ704]|nr:helix-turn-helix domain-containing protein [Pseudomonas sp. NyZ704]